MRFGIKSEAGLKTFQFSLSSFGWFAYCLFLVLGCLILQDERYAFCGLSQKQSWRLAGPLATLVFCSIPHVLVYCTKGAPIVSGCGSLVPLLSILILAVSGWIQLKSTPSALVYGFLCIYTFCGLAVVILTNLGDKTLEISYQTTRDLIFSGPGIALFVILESTAIILFVLLVLTIKHDKSVPNLDSVLHSRWVFVAIINIVLFAAMLMFANEAFSYGYYDEGSGFSFMMGLNLYMHVEAMNFSQSGPFIGLTFIMANFITTIGNNSFNHIFSSLWNENPYYYIIIGLHGAMCVCFGFLMIMPENHHLVLEVVVQDVQMYVTMLRNAAVSRSGCLGDRLCPREGNDVQSPRNPNVPHTTSHAEAFEFTPHQYL